MSAGRSGTRAGWFAGAAGAVVLAGLGARLCPGTCTGCASCIGSVVPMLGSVTALGAAVVVGRGVRRPGAADERAMTAQNGHADR